MIEKPPVQRESGVHIGTVMGDIRDSVIAGRDVVYNLFLGDESELVRRQRDRRDLLKMVKTLWINGVLEPSLRGYAPVDLTLHETSRAGMRAVNLPRFGPESGDQPNTASAAQVCALFERANGRLLILGEPGAGKTTLLLLLAQQLIEQAEDDERAQVPVVVNLASWKNGQPLQDWLAAELYNLYMTPRRTARRWLENDALILLLDGLDEVPAPRRQSCVEALNAYMQESRAPLVVCSRSEAAPQAADRLELRSVVRVQNLTVQQIDAYLAEAGQPLAGLRAALREDGDLRDLAGTPLMLHVLDTVYRGRPAEEIHAGGDAQQRRGRLWAAYVERMFARRPGAPETTVGWLAKLARMMESAGAKVLLIERIQPSWLSPGWLRALYLLLTRLLLAALFTWKPLNLIHDWTRTLLPFWLLWSGVDLFFFFVVRGRGPRLLRFWAHLAVLLAVFVFFFSSTLSRGFQEVEPLMRTVTAFVMALLAAVMLGRRHTLEDDIRLNERLTWSWRRAARGGLLGGLAGVTIFIVLSFTINGFWSMFLWPVIVLGFSVMGLLFGVVTMPFFAFHQGELQTRRSAGEGARHTLRNLLFASVLVGGAAYVSFFLVQAFMTWQQLGARYMLPRGLEFGYQFWLLVTILSLFYFGGTDLVKHWVLRLLMALSGSTPWNWAAVLDHASDLIFLRKAGGGYLFLHRELQGYFAGLPAQARGEPARRDEKTSLRQVGGRLALWLRGVQPRRLASGLLDLHWHWLAVVLFAAAYAGLTAYFAQSSTQRQLEYVRALEAAQSAANQRSYPQAVSSADQAIAIEPNSAQAHFLRGGAYLWWGQSLQHSDPSLAQQYFLQAERDAQVAIDGGLVQPDSLGKSSQALPYFLRGKARVFRGEREAGLQDLLTAYQLGPTNRYIANDICWMGGLLGAVEQARAACDALVAAEPNNGGYRHSRGILRAAAGDLDGALEDFRFYLDWARKQGYDEASLQSYAEWAAELQAGRSPLTPDVIEWLLLW